MGINVSLNINLKEFYENGEELLKKYKYKRDINSKQAFGDYINTILDKYLKVKTLLYRYEPKYFYSFYEEPFLKKGKDSIKTDNIQNIFTKGDKIIISGIGGMGKSMLMQHFLLSSIVNKLYVPILIPLRILNYIKKNEDISILNIIHNSLTECNFKLDIKNMKYIMQNGGLLILFDGCDEVKEEIRHEVLTKVNNICNQYCNNIYILSSRPDDSFISLSNFLELQTKPLDKYQALNLINRFEYEKSIKEKFYEELDRSLYEKYKEFTSNPLLLTIMFITYINRDSTPHNLNEFYEQAFHVLFIKHDATKSGFKRERKCRLLYLNFKRVFSYICFKSFFNEQYDFNEWHLLHLINKAKIKFNLDFRAEDYLADLKNIMCMFVIDGLKYKFIHRSFQEYFAAVYTTELPDNIQTKLLTQRVYKWANYKDYLDMLYYLEGDRFDKNFIYPSLIKIKNDFNRCNKSKYEFLRLNYKVVTISNGNIIKFANDFNSSLIDIIFNIKRDKGEEAFLGEVYFKQKYEAKIAKNNLYNITISIDALKNKLGTEEAVLDLMDFYIYRFDFCLKLLRKLENNIRLLEKIKTNDTDFIDRL